jgi:hypothetical protein
MVEIQSSAESPVAMDCPLVCRYDRGRMNQSVFKALMVAFSMVMIHVLCHRTA